MKNGSYLRLLIPVDDWSFAQRARAVALGNRIERKVAALLRDGADPDRLMENIEGYFPEEPGP